MAGLALLMTLILTGCGGGGGSSVIDPRLYFVNASPDVGSVQFRLNDEAKLTSAGYLGHSTAFQDVKFQGSDVGGYDVSVNTQSPPNTTLVRTAQVFNPNTDTLVVAHGLQNYVGEDLKRLRLDTVNVNRQIVNGNRARLIIFHGFERKAGFGTPNILFKSPGENPQVQSSSIAPGSSTTLEVDSGTNDWDIQRDGTTFVYASATLTFQPGGVYLVMVSGLEDAALPTNQVKITAISLPTKS